MNNRSLLTACLATLGLAVAGWGQGDGKDVDNPADPSLSAVTEQAVTSSDGEAWVVGAIRRLTDYSASYSAPTWSPDGRYIAFGFERDGRAKIYVIGSDGSNPHRLTDHPAWAALPTWSPDGRHIAFVSERGVSDIYVIGSDGSDRRNLTNDSHWDWAPSWSPDGRHIAFVSRRGSYGKAEIYVIGSDGSNSRRLTDHPAHVDSPTWSRMVSTSPSCPSAAPAIFT